MCPSSTFRAALLLSAFFILPAARAQSPAEEEVVPLPTTLSAEQLQSLQSLSPVPIPETPEPGRRGLSRQEPELTPEQASYKLAVQKLGVDKHRFVHCDLPHGRVRTGIIARIEDRGFMLKDGILNSQWISFADLQAAPRPVAAVGTRIGQGFKWVGLGIGLVAVIPLIPLWAIGMSGEGGC